uniref:Uncharacterized protein n=1 Tax=Labrus bergylta TaxID=56723 RepID=A0A3Q3EQR1_9LABR
RSVLQMSILCQNSWGGGGRQYEIMQLDSSPLRAADIIPDLKKQFAFLSGGRGDNGSPIIVFPEFPAFGEITDGEFHNVLTYLTKSSLQPCIHSTFIYTRKIIEEQPSFTIIRKQTLNQKDKQGTDKYKTAKISLQKAKMY